MASRGDNRPNLAFRELKVKELDAKDIYVDMGSDTKVQCQIIGPFQAAVLRDSSEDAQLISQRAQVKVEIELPEDCQLFNESFSTEVNEEERTRLPV